MKVQRGDIVLVQFPFASGLGGKLRPALVVQCDRNNQRLTNIIFALITPNLRRVHEPTQLLIEVATPAGQQSGCYPTLRLPAKRSRRSRTRSYGGR